MNVYVVFMKMKTIYCRSDF
uniref:Uncharacterized protein n=1 Tax=Anguilla anguilla TaxID=7936 RepID=A0A0E9U5S1_ANGAN